MILELVEAVVVAVVAVVVVVVGKVVNELGLGRRKEYIDRKRKTARAAPPAKMRELEKKIEAGMDVVNEEEEEEEKKGLFVYGMRS